MKPTELRIGNYVLGVQTDDYDNEISAICKIVALDDVGLTENRIWFVSEDGKFDDEQAEINPIPITEQWLKDFGFYAYSNKHVKNVFAISIVNKGRNTDLLIDLIGDTCELMNGFIPTERVSLNQIKYIHQLQNLYFALSGKELEKNS